MLLNVSVPSAPPLMPFFVYASMESVEVPSNVMVAPSFALMTALSVFSVPSASMDWMFPTTLMVQVVDLPMRMGAPFVSLVSVRPFSVMTTSVRDLATCMAPSAQVPVKSYVPFAIMVMTVPEMVYPLSEPDVLATASFVKVNAAWFVSSSSPPDSLPPDSPPVFPPRSVRTERSMELATVATATGVLAEPYEAVAEAEAFCVPLMYRY